MAERHDRNLITHYERIKQEGIERTNVFQYDVNPSASQIEELFAKHEVIGVVRKSRTIWWHENVKIHLDVLDDHSCFVELEAIDRHGDFTEEQLRSKCASIKKQLRIPDAALVDTGYLR